MSLLFWDRSESSALSPPGKARSPGAARSLLLQPGGGLRLEAWEGAGERRRSPGGKRYCQDLAALASGSPRGPQV